MELDKLFSHIETTMEINRNDLELSREYWKIYRFKKGEYFNEYGNICKNLGFVISGVFRTYYIDDNLLKDNNLFLYSKNDFVTAYRSLITQTPCIYYTQSLTESTILYIHINDLRKLFDISKGWERIGRMIAEESFNKLLYRTENLLLLKAEDRYTEFLEKYPTLPEQIPQYHIASFLGLENSSLSRIKKRLKNTELVDFGQ